MAGQVEIKIPMDAAGYDELDRICEAFGQTAQDYIGAAVRMAIDSQRVRYAQRQARLASARAAAPMVQVVRTGGGE